VGISYGDTENSPKRVYWDWQSNSGDAAACRKSDGTEAAQDHAQEESREKASRPSPEDNRPSQDYGPQEETRAHGQGFGSRKTAHGEIAPDEKTLNFWLRYVG
jgi:hypothetical protein